MPEALISRESLIWLLPIVFMLHDLEELVALRPWMRRESPGFMARLPEFGRKWLNHMLNLSPERFTLIVAYEFVLITQTSILAVGWGFVYLWLGLFILFMLHLLVHIGQALLLRRIFPAVLSSLLAMPYCVLVLWRFSGDLAAAPLSVVVCLLAWLPIFAFGFAVIGRRRRA